MQVILIGVFVAIGIAILTLVVALIPALTIDGTFVAALDGAVEFLIQVFDFARWFFPFNVFVMCLGIIIIVDNWTLLSRVVQYVVGVVRG